MTRILVAEDDPLQAQLVERYLLREGHEVVVVGSGDAALLEARRNPPALLVLDIMLPGLDGLEVCRTLREEDFTQPVLLLTARSTENDLLLGLELGADDYMSKPYSPRELVARIRALLRRARQAGDIDATITVGDLLIDPVTRFVRVAGAEPLLTRAEFDLLEEFARHPAAVLTRGQLLSRLHGSDRFVTERTIDAHIKNLRGKIEDEPANPKRIVTVFGVGYKLVREA